VPRAVGVYVTEQVLLLPLADPSVQDAAGLKLPVSFVVKLTLPTGALAPLPLVSVTVAVHVVEAFTATVEGKQLTEVLVERWAATEFTVMVLLKCGAVKVKPVLAAPPSTVLAPTMLVTVAFVYVTVPDAPALMVGIVASVPNAEKALPLRLVLEAASDVFAVDRLTTVMTGVTVFPAVTLVAGGVMLAISSEYRLRAPAEVVAALALPLPEAFVYVAWKPSVRSAFPAGTLTRGSVNRTTDP